MQASGVRIVCVSTRALLDGPISQVTLLPIVQVDGRDAFELQPASLIPGESLTVTLPDPLITIS